MFNRMSEDNFHAIFVITIGPGAPSATLLATRVADFAADRCECQAGGGSDCALVSRRSPLRPSRAPSLRRGANEPRQNRGE